MATPQTGKQNPAKAATASVNASAGDTASDEFWGKIPTGQNFYIAKKCFGVQLEGYLISAKMNNLDTDRPFLSYQIRTTMPVSLVDMEGNKQEVGVGENVNVVATSAIKGALREAAFDPDNVIKIRLKALRERDIGKGRKFIDYEAMAVMNADNTPKLFPRSELGFASLPQGDDVGAAHQLDAGSPA